MWRDVFLAPPALSLVEEAQARGQEGDDGRGRMHARGEGRRRPWLVVVFEKARQLVLVIQPSVEMLTYRPGLPSAEAVVQPFVVGVIEALVLQRPFQIPVDFSHEAEVWHPLPHALRGLRPEGLRLEAPGPFEDLREHQHGHVATHAVTLPGD